MITVVQSPADISPAYNDHIYLVESDNYASADFKFIAVIKDGAGSTIAKLKAPILNGSTDQGVFNVQRIIEAYTAYQFDQNLHTFDERGSTFEYEVEFGEDGDGVEYENLTSVTRWAWNAALTRREYSTYASGDFGIAGTTVYSAKFLTTQRRRRKRNEQVDWLYYLHLPSPLAFWINYVSYRSYDAAGGLLKTVTAFTGLGLGPAGEWAVDKVPTGQNLDDVLIGDVISGTLPVVDPTASYYTVTLYDNSDQPRTEEYRIDIVDQCTQYDPISVHYLNPVGGFDSMMFDLVNRQSVQATHLQMKRQLYELGNDTYTYNLNKHALANYDTVKTTRIKLTSDWLNDQEANAVSELITSPVVFIHMDGDMIPVTVLTSQWEQKTVLNDQLFNCEIELQFDTERLQRG